MESIKHTIQWCKGEIFEGKVIMFFGFLLLLMVFSFWKFGFTTNARAMIIPLLVLSLLHVGTGISMIYINSNKKIVYIEAYNKEPEQFKQSEMKRTEGFIKLYPLTRYFSIVIITLGFALLSFIHNPVRKSIGLCVMVLGMSIIVIDYFSEERANTYHKALTDGK